MTLRKSNNLSYRKPPRIADWILRRSANLEESFSIIGDLEEEFNEIIQANGTLKAMLWYWKHVFKALPRFVYYSLYWGTMMTHNYVRTAYRNLKKYKSFSFINITGLAIGLCCSIILLLYVQHETVYDKHHQNADNIYRLVILDEENSDLGSATTPSPMAPAVTEAYPEIVSAARFFPGFRFVIEHENQKSYTSNIYFTDPQVFDIFSFDLIQGDSKSALVEPHSIVMTESFARKYFDDEDPVGRIFRIEKEDYKITGLLHDIPSTSHFTFDFLVSYATLNTKEGYRRNVLNTWFQKQVYTYLLLQDNVTIADLGKKLSAFADANMESSSDNPQHFMGLQPLTSIHLNSRLRWDMQPNGSGVYVYIMLVIALLILAVACINFTNLTISRSLNRAKEVGVRKVLGAQKKQLAIQFLTESFFMAGVAFGMALLLVQFSLPFFTGFTGAEIQFTAFDNSVLLSGLLLLGVFTGLAGGGYPAFFMSSFRPVLVLKGGKSAVSARSSFRRMLVVLQFTFSVILTVSSLTIYDQLHYIGTKDLGYNKELLITIPLRHDVLSAKRDIIKDEFHKNPDIIDFTLTASSIWESDLKIFDDRVVQAHIIRADRGYLKTFGLKVQQGRDFSDDITSDLTKAFILNETAVRALDLTSPIGTTVTWSPPWTTKEGQVIGVVNDFNFRSLHEKIQPAIIFVDYGSSENIVVRLSGNNVSGTLEYFRQIWSKIDEEEPFRFSFVDEKLARQYESERKLGTIIGFFSVLAIFISCLGLFGLASFAAEQRTREVGIRKVLGAKVRSIIGLLSGEFGRLILIANILAWPIAYYAMDTWLQTFAYKVELGASVFMYGSLITVIIALAAIGYQTIKAAYANPVDSLRYK